MLVNISRRKVETDLTFGMKVYHENKKLIVFGGHHLKSIHIYFKKGKLELFSYLV